MNTIKMINKASVGIVLAAFLQAAYGAQDEMGTGIPNFGSYSEATGVQAIVWSLTNSTVGFPSGCSSIVLTPATMGWEPYKIAIATMMLAKATDKRVRFYAHAPRDGGCGVDYVQLLD